MWNYHNFKLWQWRVCTKVRDFDIHIKENHKRPFSTVDHYIPHTISMSSIRYMPMWFIFILSLFLSLRKFRLNMLYALSSTYSSAVCDGRGLLFFMLTNYVLCGFCVYQNNLNWSTGEREKKAISLKLV